MATIIRHTWINQFVQLWQTGNKELAEVQEVVQLGIKPIVFCFETILGLASTIYNTMLLHIHFTTIHFLLLLLSS